MQDFISKGVKNVEISGIRKFYNKVKGVEGCLSLTLGQPDFDVPERIKKEIINALEENKTVYTENAGLLNLRKEISKYLQSQSIEFNEEEICITVGGSEALMSTFLSIINKGDKVLIPSIAYPAYKSCINLLGGETEEYELKKDFSIDLTYLENKLKSKDVKAVLISYPSNPTGACLTKEERDKLCEILLKYKVLIITDEIYSSLIYDEEYYSISQKKELKERIILVSGFSKMFSMTGLRLGYIACNKEFMNQIMKAHQYSVSCAPSIVQYGAIIGLKECLDDVEKMKKEFKERRDYLFRELTSMGMDVILPKGAFYMFPSIKKFNMKSDEFCEKLLKEYKLAIVPGSAFGLSSEYNVRISYAASLEDLKEGISRLKKFINSLN